MVEEETKEPSFTTLSKSRRHPSLGYEEAEAEKRNLPASGRRGGQYCLYSADFAVRESYFDSVGVSWAVGKNVLYDTLC